MPWHEVILSMERVWDWLRINELFSFYQSGDCTVGHLSLVPNVLSCVGFSFFFKREITYADKAWYGQTWTIIISFSVISYGQSWQMEQFWVVDSRSNSSVTFWSACKALGYSPRTSGLSLTYLLLFRLGLNSHENSSATSAQRPMLETSGKHTSREEMWDGLFKDLHVLCFVLFALVKMEAFPIRRLAFNVKQPFTRLVTQELFLAFSCFEASSCCSKMRCL